MAPMTVLFGEYVKVLDELQMKRILLHQEFVPA
jgi:hypothetical protein